MSQSTNFRGQQMPRSLGGHRLRESYSIIHRRKSLPESTLSHGLKESFVSTVESQLAVPGPATTRVSTPGGIPISVKTPLYPHSFRVGVPDSVPSVVNGR